MGSGSRRGDSSHQGGQSRCWYELHVIAPSWPAQRCLPKWSCWNRHLPKDLPTLIPGLPGPASAQGHPRIPTWPPCCCPGPAPPLRCSPAPRKAAPACGAWELPARPLQTDPAATGGLQGGERRRERAQWRVWLAERAEVASTPRQQGPPEGVGGRRRTAVTSGPLSASMELAAARSQENPCPLQHALPSACPARGKPKEKPKGEPQEKHRVSPGGAPAPLTALHAPPEGGLDVGLRKLVAPRGLQLVVLALRQRQGGRLG